MTTQHIEYNMPDADYRAATGVSQSSLKALARSPAHYAHALTAKREQTKAMLLGRVVHHLILTPELPEFWAVKPEGLSLATKEGKLWKASVGEDADIISSDEENAVHGAANAVIGHPEWQTPEHTEVSLFAEIDGAQCKGRLDALRGCEIIDVKTTQDARPDAFQKTAWTLKYHTQAAIYTELAKLNGITPAAFTFFAVEMEAPHACCAYVVTPELLARGYDEMHRLLALLKHCVSVSEWPGYDTALHNLTSPTWAKQL
jgi:hypothetical protein